MSASPRASTPPPKPILRPLAHPLWRRLEALVKAAVQVLEPLVDALAQHHRGPGACHSIDDDAGPLDLPGVTLARRRQEVLEAAVVVDVM